MLIPGHDVHTVVYEGWNSLSNGALLTAAEAAGFDVLVTADQGIRYQQNLTGRKIAIVVLSTNELNLVVAHAAKLVAAINTVKAGSLVAVDLGGGGEVS